MRILLRLNVTLPIAREIDARLRGHRQPGDAAHLFAVAQAAIVLTP
jgi:hypothetical protein